MSEAEASQLARTQALASLPASAEPVFWARRSNGHAGLVVIGTTANRPENAIDWDDPKRAPRPDGCRARTHGNRRP